MHSTFSSVLRRLTASTPRVRRSLRPASIECLESRIAPAAVIAGIGSGLHKNHVAFVDADGDRVDVAISGGGYFDVTLNGGKTNGADIDHLTIKGATASSSLAIRVLSLAAGGGSLTPGTSEVNSITSDYTGTMVGISLLSAEVQDLNLGNVALKGGLSLSVANALRADLINQKVMNTGGLQYEAVAPGIDFNNINLASAGTISVAGAVGHAGDDFSTNDFDGAINITGALGKLVGANSVLHGSVTAGTLSGVQVGHLRGSLGSTGDMTLDLKTLEADVSVNVGGNLNLRLGYANGNAAIQSGFFGTITVDGNVSGLAAGILDPIAVRGNFAGSLNVGGNVANLAIVAGSGVTTGQFTGTLSSEGNIGSVSAQRGFSGGGEEKFSEQDGSSVSANGNIGNISSLGTNSGTFFAGGSIGNITSTVTARFEDAFAGATFVAQDNIGTIIAKSFNGSAVRNTSVQSYGGSIGDTLADVTNLTGSDAIENVSYTAATGTVGNISGTSAGASGISGLHVNANQVLTITGVAGISSFGDGIQYSSVVSNTTIGNVFGLAQGFYGSDGIDSVSLQANGSFFVDRLAFGKPLEPSASIGFIHGHTEGTGNGIIGLNAHSAGGIALIVGEADSFRGASGLAGSTVEVSGGYVSQITGSTSGSGSGITDLTASSASGIGSIIGNAYGQAGQHGIANTTVGVAYGINLVSGTSGFADGADGISHSTFSTNYLGQIDADGHGRGASHGIEDTSFTSSFIGNVDASASNSGAEALTTTHFNATQVGMITVRSSANIDHSITASTIGTGNAYFNYAGVNSDHSIDLAFDTTGGQGTLGGIDVSGDFDYAALSGVRSLSHFAVSGAVKGLVGNGEQFSSIAETITVGREFGSSNQTGSDVTFDFADYQGTPDGMIAGDSQMAGYSSAGVRIIGAQNL